MTCLYTSNEQCPVRVIKKQYLNIGQVKRAGFMMAEKGGLFRFPSFLFYQGPITLLIDACMQTLDSLNKECNKIYHDLGKHILYCSLTEGND